MKEHRTLRIKGGNTIAFLNTSRLPDEEVIKRVRFALADMNVDKTCVHVRNSGRGGWSGMAYYYIPTISNAPSWCRSLITMRVSSLDDVLDGAAHEGKHIEEHREGRYRRNKRERSTERKARAAQMKVWKRWEARPQPEQG